MLKNYMEVAVEIILADIMKKEKLKCSCSKCLDDIIGELARSMKIVEEAPRHD